MIGFANCCNVEYQANRAAAITGSSMRRRTTSIRKTRKNTTTLTFGKNGWLFCTAAVPANQEEEEAFWKAMKPAYDHAYDIHQPTVFALALSARVADQLGPRGSEAKLESKIEGNVTTSCHKRQTVFHGPVIYTEEPYELITRASFSNKLAKLLLPLFTKRTDYQAHREYRYVIFTEHEPPEPYVDLEVSSWMWSLMQGRKDTLPNNPARPTVDPDGPADHEQDDLADEGTATTRGVPAIAFMRSGESDGLPDPFDLLKDPTVPIRPHLSGFDP